MNTLASAAALTGLLAAGIIYGTDVFCPSSSGLPWLSLTTPPWPR